MKPLVEYLPPHIAADDEVRHIEEALTVVMEREWAANEDLINQIFPQLATWTLRYWERFYGIRTDVNLTEAQRREVLIAKIRSAKTATVEVIRAVAAAWANGEVAVREYNDEYRFEITFVSQFGVPEKMDELKAAIDAVKPAHLAVEYMQRYLLVREVHPMRIGELHATPLFHFAGGGED